MEIIKTVLLYSKSKKLNRRQKLDQDATLLLFTLIHGYALLNLSKGY